jgi:hypothetical protein
MAKSITVNANKRGRPVTTGTGTIVGVRMLDRPLAALDAWISDQKDPELSRPEAIRRLVELGLTVTPKARPTECAQARAAELAVKAINKIGDPTAHPEQHARRQHRLTKGPEEFREVRVDRPKAKGSPK